MTPEAAAEKAEAASDELLVTFLVTENEALRDAALDELDAALDEFDAAMEAASDADN
jgi:hypothetical protein